AVAVHTSDARKVAAMDPWTPPLYQLVTQRSAPAPVALPLQVTAGP
ncbi:cutinase, partial [Enterococcus faecium]